jgi:hypothetical protein
MRTLIIALTASTAFTLAAPALAQTAQPSLGQNTIAPAPTAASIARHAAITRHGRHMRIYDKYDNRYDDKYGVGKPPPTETQSYRPCPASVILANGRHECLG